MNRNVDAVPSNRLRVLGSFAGLALLAMACSSQASREELMDAGTSGAPALHSDPEQAVTEVPVEEPCPPDITQPIESPNCDVDPESIDGKIPEAFLGVLEQDSPLEVLLMLKTHAQFCALPECRTPPCNDEAVFSYWDKQNLAAQVCVRTLIAELGGTVLPDDGGFVNSFKALLNGPQIQLVAAHPHVQSVGPTSGGGVAVE